MKNLSNKIWLTVFTVHAAVVEARKNKVVDVLIDCAWILFLGVFVEWVFGATTFEYFYMMFGTMGLMLINDFFKK